jgi:hypothetical protein
VLAECFSLRVVPALIEVAADHHQDEDHFRHVVAGVHEGVDERLLGRHRLVPRVLDMLGITYDRNRIIIVDYGGTGNLALLARYAGEPVLGRDYGRAWPLTGP